MKAAPRPLAIALLLFTLAGCASSGDYPSLALRDAERVAGSASAAPAEAEAPIVLPPPGADTLTRIDGLLGAAREAHARFQRKQEATRRTVGSARGASIASDNWVAAQVALADLQSARSGVVTALAELDGMYVDARVAEAATVSPTAQAIGSARDTVESWVAQENAAIASLAGTLRS
ncbi:hypothetical protein [Novosphingobium aquimarinum]|uniref:hypothetical protein n=1 Tax=Novosphingobium aquimarinum TaxID=2682494 RepID=UPI0012EC5BE6|nr:hypothetical protein [Novosphingobium aquimarinum]